MMTQSDWRLVFVFCGAKTKNSAVKNERKNAWYDLMLGTSKHAEWYSRLSCDGIFFFANTCGIGGITIIAIVTFPVSCVEFHILLKSPYP